MNANPCQVFLNAFKVFFIDSRLVFRKLKSSQNRLNSKGVIHLNFSPQLFENVSNLNGDGNESVLMNDGTFTARERRVQNVFRRVFWCHEIAQSTMIFISFSRCYDDGCSAKR
jgi:hypothetical protein